MSIDCKTIKQVLGIEVRTIFGRDNPPLDFILVYTRKPNQDSSTQKEYMYPTTPSEIRKVVGDLLKLGLINSDVHEELVGQMGDLEKGLLSRMNYKYYTS